MPSSWAVFQALCRIIGGRDRSALDACVEQGLMPHLIGMASSQAVLPALAVRCYAQPAITGHISDENNRRLRDALLANTRRNMQIVLQAGALIRTLNDADIKPLLLKGTAQLLTVNRENPGFRQQADIDLLVKPGALLAAGEALRTAGYGYYRRRRALEIKPGVPGDTQAAIRVSAAHHHLPPLVKRDQVAFVELHRHFLPRRFQHENPLQPLFDCASEHQINGAGFLVPSTEHQIIHIVLGRLVHDGCLTRREFPIREACDYVGLMDSAQGLVDRSLVTKHCGKAFGVFDQLVAALTGYQATGTAACATDLERRIATMRRRYNDPARARLLDYYARCVHLANSMWYSPSKLAAYVSR